MYIYVIISCMPKTHMNKSIFPCLHVQKIETHTYIHAHIHTYIHAFAHA